MKLCADRLSSLSMGEDDTGTGMYPFGYSIDFTVAKVAADIGEGFFGGAVFALNPDVHSHSHALKAREGEAALVLMDAVSETLTNFRSYTSKSWITLSPYINASQKNSSASDLSIENRWMSLRAKPHGPEKQKPRYLMNEMNSMITFNVNLGQWGPPFVKQKVSSPYDQSLIEERSKVQATIHRILSKVGASTHTTQGILTQKQYAQLTRSVKRWIELDFSLYQNKHSLCASTLPTEPLTRFVCGVIKQMRMLIPARFLKKKRTPQLKSSSFKNLTITPHRITVREMISPLLSAVIQESKSEAEPDLPNLPDFTLDDITTHTEPAILGDRAASSSNPRRAGTTSIDSLVEKLFGKNTPTDTNNPIVVQPVPSFSAQGETQYGITPMCLEGAFHSPPQLLNDGKSVEMTALQLPPLIPGTPVVGEIGFNAALDTTILPSLEKPTTDTKKCDKRDTNYSQKIKKRALGRKRRRRKALEIIDSDKHPIPTTDNKKSDLWRTNPLTKQVSPPGKSTRFYCQIPSCYQGKKHENVTSYSKYPILMQHYKYHTTPPQFCSICNESFASTGSCNTHIRKQHPDQIDPGMAPPRAKRTKVPRSLLNFF